MEVSMTPEESSRAAERICDLAVIVPVITVDELSHAQPLARALVKGGLKALEVTLRTPVALDAIREMASVEGGVVGAGTLLTPKDVHDAVEAGAKFGVSPGATDRLLDAALEAGLPMLPGAATPSEVMRLLEKGYRVQKFFPAEAAGGVPMLKSMGGPLPQVGFCPTGGIGPDNASRYLTLPNVLCAGGSWVAPKHLMAKGDWAAITALAKAAASIER
jgi:2-dehydro-3-deoxyphosphogluconate aldolase/(4S)-4-hydroxy-2-oxoglutarate aldolase